MAGRTKRKGLKAPGQAVLGVTGVQGGARAVLPARAKDLAGLEEEITQVRDLIRRVSERAEAGLDTEDLLKVLQGVSLSSTRLAALLKSQRSLFDEQDSGAAINQALADLLREVSQLGEG